jgi:hypothetical protein
VLPGKTKTGIGDFFSPNIDFVFIGKHSAVFIQMKPEDRAVTTSIYD